VEAGSCAILHNGQPSGNFTGAFPDGEVVAVIDTVIALRLTGDEDLHRSIGKPVDRVDGDIVARQNSRGSRAVSTLLSASLRMGSHG
jgi:hypothetical protein